MDADGITPAGDDEKRRRRSRHDRQRDDVPGRCDSRRRVRAHRRYIVGPDQDKERPDLAIEVIWTSGSIDKLEIYRRLKVGEVWFWKDGVLSVHVLSQGRYQRAERSALLPALDLALLCSFLDRRSATEAMRDFRDALRTRP